MSNKDLNENTLEELFPGVLDILLEDHSSNKNIMWCTNNYKRHGIGFGENDQIKKELITNHYKKIIRPRISKSQTEQRKRSKDMAEVFTPSWICNLQNNMIDDEWFGYPNAFNEQVNDKWLRTQKVLFKNNTWKQYVDLERLEITCGEAPYLTSRYDVVSGVYIEPMDRVGLLDRKLRVISENINDEKEWILYSQIALKRIYGYDYQGDNVLLARENLLLTTLEFYEEKFNKKADIEYVLEIAKIISWNIWQMDGIKYVVPMSCHKEEPIFSLFPEFDEEPEFCRGCLNGNEFEHNGTYCKIKDWKNKKIIRFVDTLK